MQSNIKDNQQNIKELRARGHQENEIRRSERNIKNKSRSEVPHPVSIKREQKEVKNDVKDNINKIKYQITPRRSESPKYKPHTGVVSGVYQQFGGLGPATGDEKWNEVSNRRK